METGTEQKRPYLKTAVLKARAQLTDMGWKGAPTWGKVGNRGAGGANQRDEILSLEVGSAFWNVPGISALLRAGPRRVQVPRVGLYTPQVPCLESGRQRASSGLED